MSVKTDVMFFFQAEDGIRYLVRSRGLGDVYKRQGELPPTRYSQSRRNPCALCQCIAELAARDSLEPAVSGAQSPVLPPIPVSYTHLTLPTSDLV